MLAAELLTSSADNPDESQPARTLLDNEDALNLYFAPRVDPSIAGKKLTPIAWEQVIEKEPIPNWTAAVLRYFRLFDGHSIGSLPEAVTKVAHIEQQLLAHLAKSSSPKNERNTRPICSPGSGPCYIGMDGRSTPNPACIILKSKTSH
jgi:hypothetical protein